MMKTRWINLLILSLVAIYGCSSNEQGDEEEGYPVRIGEVTRADVPNYLYAIGELTGSRTIDVRAQVSGILTNILFADGKLVNEGDLLMTIDPQPFEAELKAAEAQLAEDKARLKYALDFAETYGSLVGKEYVARLDYAQGIQNVGVYQSAVIADEAAIEKAKINLAYTRIHSTLHGYIGLRDFDPGNYIDTNQNSTLVTIRQVTPLSLNFSIPGSYVQKIREKQEVSPLYIEAYLVDDPIPLKGTLTFIDNTVNTETGMLFLQGTMPNKEERGWPGQFVRVHLLLEIIPQALLVPTEAIVLGQEGYFVFVVLPDQTVESRKVEKGISYNKMTIINKGLIGTETVVIDGQLNLYPGAKISLPYFETPQDHLPERAAKRSKIDAMMDMLKRTTTRQKNT